MKKPAADTCEGRNSWQRLCARAGAMFSRADRGALVVLWVWVALKAAIGEDGGQSDSVMSGAVLITGLICLVGLMMLGDGDGSLEPWPYQASYQSLHCAPFPRRSECRIVADSRCKGVPQIAVTADQPADRPVVAVRKIIAGTSSVRPAKIKPPHAPSKSAAGCMALSA